MKSRKSFRWAWLCLVFLAISGTTSLFVGCDTQQTEVRETDERAFRRGQGLLKEGNNDEALAAFLSVIETRRTAPESHLEAGLLYLNHVRDPLSAIYHFKKYLEIRPAADQRSVVEELIATAQKEYLKQLPGKPYENETSRLDLMAKVEELNRENEQLRQRIVTGESQIAQLQDRLSRATDNLQLAQQRLAQADQPIAPIIIAERPDPNTAAATTTGPRTYTVEAGDTLSTISRKMYGTPNRWTEIYDANRDVLPNAQRLSVGQTLRIP